MTNLLTKTTELARYLWLPYCDKDKIAVDATCGNGNDTLFLAANCGFVYGFDIQETAINNTDNLLKEHGLNNYRLFNLSHSEMSSVMDTKADLIVFNLGYLPSGDKAITTETESTLKALSQSLDLLNINGLISIILYCGHESGKKEKEEVLEYCRNLDKSRYHCGFISFINQPNCPPEIVMITRKR